NLQSLEQPSPSALPPSSHSSGSGSPLMLTALGLTLPSPHDDTVQSRLQCPGSSLRSQGSWLFLMLSPQNSYLQLDEQPSLESGLPSSHCSPGSRMPLPHLVDWQVIVHTPSMPFCGPLSQTSMWFGPAESSLPSPQRLMMQSARQSLLSALSVPL